MRSGYFSLSLALWSSPVLTEFQADVRFSQKQQTSGVLPLLSLQHIHACLYNLPASTRTTRQCRDCDVQHYLSSAGSTSSGPPSAPLLSSSSASLIIARKSASTYMAPFKEHGYDASVKGCKAVHSYPEQRVFSDKSHLMNTRTTLLLATQGGLQ